MSARPQKVIAVDMALRKAGQRAREALQMVALQFVRIRPIGSCNG